MDQNIWELNFFGNRTNIPVLWIRLQNLFVVIDGQTLKTQKNFCIKKSHSGEQKYLGVEFFGDGPNIPIICASYATKITVVDQNGVYTIH